MLEKKAVPAPLVATDDRSCVSLYIKKIFKEY
jgi:hypothetical protein